MCQYFENFSGKPWQVNALASVNQGRGYGSNVGLIQPTVSGAVIHRDDMAHALCHQGSAWNYGDEGDLLDMTNVTGEQGRVLSPDPPLPAIALLLRMGLKGSAPLPHENELARLRCCNLIDSGSDLIKRWLN